MKKFKRWILILTALTVFVVVQVESLRATSLIHAGKFSKLLNSSSTSSTTALPSSTPTNDHLRELLDEIPEDEEGVIDVNGTKITLTGIPQIDYVWDPNLPRELNGFNLSSYPFLDSMPAEEDIGFDCEDKINGFYASIKFGCQLYHHCLYGVRSDFICANFTAFDQKTFICHFASEVDCKNSKKYWNRNDDLYKATTVKSTTTSTVVPLIDRGFYNRTRYSFLNGGSNQNSNNNNNNNNNSPSQSNNDPLNISGNRDGNINPPSSNNNNNRNNNNNNNNDFNVDRPSRPSRRPPYRRRRPIDYYYYDDEIEDDYYEARRRNRPRNRRPIYDDYDARRPDTRRPYFNDDYDDYEYERRPMRNRNRSESRNNGGRYEDRRVGNIDRRRPIYDDDRRRNPDKRPAQDDRVRSAAGYSEERKFSDDDRRDRFDDNRNFNSRRNNPLDENKRKQADAVVVERKENVEETISDEKHVNPVGTSIFDRARPPPRISRPVPLSEKSKFAYKASDTQNENVQQNEKNVKYDDSYEYEDISVSSSTASTTTVKAFSFQKLKPATSFPTTTKSITTSTSTAATDDVTEVEYLYEDEYYDTVGATPTQSPIIETSSIKTKDERTNLFSSRVRNENFASSTIATTSSTSKTAASSPDSFRLNRYKTDNSKENIQQQQQNQQTYVDPLVKKPLVPSIIPNVNINRKFANKQTVFEPVTTNETPIKQNNFQNAYNNRNLDSKDVELIAENKEQYSKSPVKVIKRPFLPSRGGSPYKGRGLNPVGLLAAQLQQMRDADAIKDGNRNQPEKLTLEDLYNEEYDVDLNDALNPMLKPLTSSRNIHTYPSTVDVNDKDNRKILSKADHYISKSASQTATTTDHPEYYDDDTEYTYDDAAV